MPEERRVVTVLFADVVGSTALGERSDPEDVRAVLGRYYAIAREILGEHGGTVEKFIGDAVMAVFGVPQAHGDDPERALASALALRERLRTEPATADLAIRIGINTGEVVAERDAGRGDFLVTGDAVNTAARLQQSAEPGAILVGGRTRAAARGFRFGPERALAVKGKEARVSASTLEERAAAARPAAPFVGREADLAQLQLVAHRAFFERRPQLVTITASAGTGKSRLVEEFLSALRARDVNLKAATAQCLPYGSAVTFLPLRGLVRGLVGADDDQTALDRVREVLAGSGYGADDASRLCGLIGATLGQSAEPTNRDREEFFGAWRVLVEAASAARPVVVVFEDLHWASDSLLDLIESITHPRVAAPLLMIVLARPELFDRRPAWGGGRRNFTALGLDPLSADETRRLVSLLTEGAPATLAERIVERAEGNPFFAGELVRAYEERREAGASESEIVLPDTVQATVLARLDALPARERTVLQYAAVAGRTARPDAIEAALGERGDGTNEALASLVERELLAPRPPDAFVFRHIVIREVAYSTLPRAERARAHVSVARHLGDRGQRTGEELVELVAYHYRQALSLSPAGVLPEGVDAATVVGVLERAGAVAWTGGAYEEAADHLGEALRLAPPQDHLRLYEAVGDIFQFGDRGADAYAQAYERWSALAPAERDAARGIRLLRKLLTLYARWTGSLRRPPEGARFAELLADARALLARQPDPEEDARLTLVEGFWSRQIERAVIERLLPAVRRASEMLSASGDANVMSLAMDALGSIERDLGNYDEAIACARRRLSASDRLTALERNDAFSVLAWDLVYQGRYRDAIAATDEARRARRAGEPEAVLIHVLSWGAHAARLVGEWDRALETADFLRTVWEEVGRAIFGRFTMRGWYAGMWVARARGDATRLAAYRSAATAIADIEAVTTDQPLRSQILVLLSGDSAAAAAGLVAPGSIPAEDMRAAMLAELLFELDATVPDAVIAGIEHARESRIPLLAAMIRLARALNERKDDALREAVAELERADLGPDAARATALLARRTKSPTDVAEARRRLERFGDVDYLARLEEWT